MLQLMASAVRHGVAPPVSEFFPKQRVHLSPGLVSDEDAELEPVRANVDMKELVPHQTGDGG